MNKTKNPIEALAEIKILINKFYEEIGRNGEEEDDYELMNTLVEDIEELIKSCDIPAKMLIIKRFEMDGKNAL